MSKNPTRKITVRVSPQTAYNLELLMAMSGAKSAGRVIDKLVRDRMLALKGHKEEHSFNSRSLLQLSQYAGLV